ncbi:acetyl xylan esterase [Citrobacter gillenii]
MQVDQQSQAAPELALTGAEGVLKRMQSHAPYACMA